MAAFHIALFIGSSIVLAVAGNWLVNALNRLARFFSLKEFVAAFFLMSFAVSIPELFIGLSAAFKGIPELSFGNIVGANVIHFTLAIALGTLFLGGLGIESKMVQTSTVFTVIIAVLPALLILDGDLSHIDGLVLISFFLFYSVWLFSKKDRFTKIYDHDNKPGDASRFRLFRDIAIFALGAILLLASAQGIITSATFFAHALNLPLVVVGILIVGFGTALPETYFSIIAGRNGNSWIIVGNLLGATVFTTTMVLGLVALIHPITVTDFSPYAVSRIFLALSALLFLFFIRTHRRISRREAVILLFLYIAFVFVETLLR